jgi:hypothetical protein
MKNSSAAQNSKIQRAAIDDLSIVGNELSDEHLQLASGGLCICASYEPASCTVGGGTDYHRVD